MRTNKVGKNCLDLAENNPPCGTYDQTQNTIGEIVKRKAECGLSNPLLANLKAKKSANLGFSSTQKRFDGKKIDENEAFLGPGYYEHKTFVDEK